MEDKISIMMKINLIMKVDIQEDLNYSTIIMSATINHCITNIKPIMI